MSAPRSIEPSTAPGGLVFKVFVGAREVAHGQADDPRVVETMALAHGDAANAAMAAAGETESRVYIYDGDSGECVGTLVVD